MTTTVEPGAVDRCRGLGCSLAAQRSAPSCSLRERVREVAVVDDVAHAVALGLEVLVVVRSDADEQRHLLDESRPKLAQLGDLVGVVGQQAHPLDAEVGEDAGCRRVVAGVGGQAEREVGVDGVEAALLQAVRAQLVDEPDAATLVAAHVDDDAALLLDRVERGVELRAALALERAERLAGQALGVHAHERRLGEVARDDGEVVGAGDAVLVGEEAEVAVRGRHGRLGAQAHAAPVRRRGRLPRSARARRGRRSAARS